jgi:hypothetical protein
MATKNQLMVKFANWWAMLPLASFAVKLVIN